MEFGRVTQQQLSDVDFTLPPGNTDVLNGVNGAGKLYIGLPRWGNADFVGTLYPRGVKEKDFLSYYVTHFNTIELNATHYNIQAASRVENWALNAIDKDFKFCPKMFKGITHAGSLLDKQNELNAFVESIRFFGSTLGPVFIQLADSFSLKRARELETFLKSLPSDLTYFVEIRGTDWYQNGNWYTWLQGMKIGAVITDAAGRRDGVHMNLTIPRAMIRFVANNHPTDTKRIEDWITRIKEWQQKGIEEIYFFVHSENEIESPGIVDQIRQALQ